MFARGSNTRQWPSDLGSLWQNHVVDWAGEPGPFGGFQGDSRPALGFSGTESMGLLSDETAEFFGAYSGESELDLGALSSVAGDSLTGGDSTYLPAGLSLLENNHLPELDQLMGHEVVKVDDFTSQQRNASAGTGTAGAASAHRAPFPGPDPLLNPPDWPTDPKSQTETVLRDILGPVMASAPTNHRLPQRLQNEIYAGLTNVPVMQYPYFKQEPATAGEPAGPPTDGIFTTADLFNRMLAMRKADGQGMPQNGAFSGTRAKSAMAAAEPQAAGSDTGKSNDAVVVDMPSDADPAAGRGRMLRPRRHNNWPSTSPTDLPGLAVPAARHARRRGSALAQCSQMRRSTRASAAAAEAAAAEAAAAAARAARAATRARTHAAAEAEAQAEAEADEGKEEPKEDETKPVPRQRTRKPAPPPPAPFESDIASESASDDDGDVHSDSSDDLYEPDFSEDSNGGVQVGGDDATTSSASSAREAGTTTVTLEVLAELFDLSMNEAAKLLGIGSTSLKKICRQLGIKRWPQRNRKSLMLLRDHLLAEAASADGPASGVSEEELNEALAEIAELLTAGGTTELSAFLKRVRQKCFKHKHVQRKRKREGSP